MGYVCALGECAHARGWGRALQRGDRRVRGERSSANFHMRSEIREITYRSTDVPRSSQVLLGSVYNSAPYGPLNVRTCYGRRDMYPRTEGPEHI